MLFFGAALLLTLLRGEFDVPELVLLLLGQSHPKLLEFTLLERMLLIIQELLDIRDRVLILSQISHPLIC